MHKNYTNIRSRSFFKPDHWRTIFYLSKGTNYKVLCEFWAPQAKFFWKAAYFFQIIIFFLLFLVSCFKLFFFYILYFGGKNSAQGLRFLSKFPKFCQILDPQHKKRVSHTKTCTVCFAGINICEFLLFFRISWINTREN